MNIPKPDIEALVRNVLPRQEKEVKKGIKNFIDDTVKVLVKDSGIDYHVEIEWEEKNERREMCQ